MKTRSGWTVLCMGRPGWAGDGLYASRAQARRARRLIEEDEAVWDSEAHPHKIIPVDLYQYATAVDPHALDRYLGVRP